MFIIILILICLSILLFINSNKLSQSNNEMKQKLDEIGYTELEEIKKKINILNAEILEKENKISQVKNEYDNKILEVKNNYDSELKNREIWIKSKIKGIDEEFDRKKTHLENMKILVSINEEENKKLLKNIETQKNKLKKSKEILNSIQHCITEFLEYSPILSNIKTKITNEELSSDDLVPTVILPLHSMDSKTLKTAFRNNEKQINALLKEYNNRYTTKSNKTIYDLMCIALNAELQNILYNLKYEKLENAISQIKTVTQKYYHISSDGNKQIAPTILKFIGQLEYFYIEAVKIEYNYYVKREQAKQEQLALKQQMKEEAEERRLLELEKKKVLNEENKYNNEIERIKLLQENSKDNEEIEKLKQQLLKLEEQLAEVVLKKEEISSLQNGKAGYVYVISNKGSFGENMFKIGMTRRLDPQDRINELGNASVPFKFDVHSFIFSENAVGLETQLHQKLNDKRVNKVNIRKEFFYSTVDELEILVQEIDETAEFTKTMMAEEYNQSISSDEIYSSDIKNYEDDEDE